MYNLRVLFLCRAVHDELTDHVYTDKQMTSTVLLNFIIQREKSEHATEMSELQEKLKKDMLAFQEKLQHVQQQTMLTKAENLAKEAEV